MMNSLQDYQIRFIKEYVELDSRIVKLEIMLEKYRKNQLDFKPTCSYEIMLYQLHGMKMYRTGMRNRVKFEFNFNTLEEAEDFFNLFYEEHFNG